jgi:hypothetical protein
MSASNELLVERINRLKEAIELTRARGGSTIVLENQLQALNKQLEASQTAINESRVLKG